MQKLISVASLAQSVVRRFTSHFPASHEPGYQDTKSWLAGKESLRCGGHWGYVTWKQRKDWICQCSGRPSFKSSGCLRIHSPFWGVHPGNGPDPQPQRVLSKGTSAYVCGKEDRISGGVWKATVPSNTQFFSRAAKSYMRRHSSLPLGDPRCHQSCQSVWQFQFRWIREMKHEVSFYFPETELLIWIVSDLKEFISPQNLNFT